MEPSLRHAQFGFNGKLSEPRDLIRNTLTFAATLVDSKDFDKLKFTFKSEAEGEQQALDLQFTRVDFVELTGPTASDFVKMVVLSEIKKQSEKEAQVDLSIRHQVLCDETAIIGVMKQTDTATGELKEAKIAFGREDNTT